MHIYNHVQNPSFGILRFNKSELVKKAPENIITSVNKLTAELAETKHWDLGVFINDSGKPDCEYIFKKVSDHIYCEGIKNSKEENNIINGTLLWVKNLSDGYKEYYESFIDLTFETVEQAKNALKVFNSPEKTLEYEANIVKILDSAKEIVLDDTTRFIQNV